MRLNRDRNGELINIEFEGHEVLPPPISEKHVGKLFYENKQLVDVVNELLDRVHRLEQKASMMQPTCPEPSVEYPYRKH